VTLYTVPNCEGCDAARSLLNARGVPFKEVSLTDAATTEDFKKNVGAASLPTMLVGSQQQVGFEEGAYQRMLDDAGYPATGIVPPRRQGAPTAAAAPAPKPSAPQAKPAVAEPAEQQPTGPYAPGAAPPPPPTKKK
jgi:glutaredoxin